MSFDSSKQIFTEEAGRKAPGQLFNGLYNIEHQKLFSPLYEGGRYLPICHLLFSLHHPDSRCGCECMYPLTLQLFHLLITMCFTNSGTNDIQYLSTQIAAKEDQSFKKINLRGESFSSSHYTENEVLQGPIYPSEEAQLSNRIKSMFVRNIWGKPSPLTATIPEFSPVRVSVQQFFPSYLSLGEYRELFPYMQGSVKAKAQLQQPTNQFPVQINVLDVAQTSSLVRPSTTYLSDPDMLGRPGKFVAQNLPSFHRPVDFSQGTEPTRLAVMHSCPKDGHSYINLKNSSSSNIFQQPNKHARVPSSPDEVNSHNKVFPCLASRNDFQRRAINQSQNISGICEQSHEAQWLKCMCTGRSWDFHDMGVLMQNLQIMSFGDDGYSTPAKIGVPYKDVSPRRLYRDVLANSSTMSGDPESAYDELERQALEQYHPQDTNSSSDMNIEDKLQELEQQAIEQYQNTGMVIGGNDCPESPQCNWGP